MGQRVRRAFETEPDSMLYIGTEGDRLSCISVSAVRGRVVVYAWCARGEPPALHLPREDALRLLGALAEVLRADGIDDSILLAHVLAAEGESAEG